MKRLIPENHCLVEFILIRSGKSNEEEDEDVHFFDFRLEIAFFLGKFGSKNEHFLKMKFGTPTNLNIQNSMVKLCWAGNTLFWTNLVQELEIERKFGS